MGLSLEDPASSLSDLTEFRHLPPAPALPKADKTKISKARFFSWVDRYDLQSQREGETSDGTNTVFYHRRELRPHQIALLAASRRRPTHLDGRNAPRLAARRRWPGECDEGRDLARSAVRLPSDADRGRRPPSLERQQAFCSAATSKKRQRVLDADDADVDTAELYRLGLLYDDEHERGSGFSLDAIVHNEPVYKLNVRHAKRGRKTKAFERPDVAALPLDLSFAAFGDDDALARYLISPDEDELAAAGPASSTSQTQRATNSRTPLITVIYELDDGENPDETSPRSFHVPRENDFPDLVSDNDNDDDNDDWALLNNKTDGDEDGGATPGNPDAWIVLG